jgi:hypothetical protein
VQARFAVPLALLAVVHAAATPTEPQTASNHHAQHIAASTLHAGSRKLLSLGAVSKLPDSLATATVAAVPTAARHLQGADKIDISQCSRISEGARVCGRGLVYSCCGGSECFSIRSAEEAARASGNGGYSGVCDLSVQSFACCKT